MYLHFFNNSVLLIIKKLNNYVIKLEKLENNDKDNWRLLKNENILSFVFILMIRIF